VEQQHAAPSFIRYFGLMLCLLGTTWLLSACMQSPQTTTTQPEQTDPSVGQVETEAMTPGGAVKLKAVATTGIVADVVRQIAADRIELTVLLPVGVDPHAFEPTPQDVATVADAHIVFASGAGLEEFLDELIENAGGDAQIVALSEGLELRTLEANHTSHANEREDEGRARPEAADPHTWFAPSNVKAWADRVEEALGDLDPANSGFYRANAQSYKVTLDELDAWIAERVSEIPAENRKLVTDHAAFGYFADRYGFQQIGAVFPGFSTASDPSAQEIARLVEAVRQYDVNAIFVGTTINPRLSQRIADETGTELVTLYTGSLSEPGGEAETYVGLMRYNVEAIVEALK
jgi:ABC-type Zn uptake system ZnuABC Zn-binding protein ZnuA